MPPNDPALEALANLLKTTQSRRIAEQRPMTPPVTVPNQAANFAPMAGPQAMGAAMPQPAVAPPMAPMTPPNPAPNLPPASDAQSNLPMQSATAADAFAVGPQPISSGIWDTLKKMLANGQVPEGYRGAMGEMIKNT